VAGLVNASIDVLLVLRAWLKTNLKTQWIPAHPFKGRGEGVRRNNSKQFDVFKVSLVYVYDP